MRFSKLVSATILFIGVSQIAYAQDMSGWSDKTVCRLAETQKSNSAYVREVNRRKLSCVSGETVNRAVKNANPLTELKVVPNWNPIKNREVFDQERAIISSELQHHLRYVDQENDELDLCLVHLGDADNSLMSELRGKKEKEPWARFGNYTVAHCLNVVPHRLAMLGYTPQFMGELLLHWAENNMLNLLTNRYDPAYQDNTYLIPNIYSPWAAHYAFYYDEYAYNDEERAVVENYLVDKLLTIDHTKLLEGKLKPCNPNSLTATIRGALDGSMDIDGCDSVVWRTLPAKLALGLRLENQELFDKGVETTLYMLKFFDKQGIFVPFAASKGASALSYQEVVTSILSIVSEIFYTLDYDFLEHRLDNGVYVKDIYAAQIKLLDNPKMIWKYVKNHGNYGNSDIFTRKNIFRWMKPEHKEEWWYHAGTSMEETIRESARYVDTYRPDLQHLRKQSFVEKTANKSNIQLVSNYSFVEAYKWYEANTKTELDPETRYIKPISKPIEPAIRNGISSKDIKTEKELEQFLEDNEEEYDWSN